jgi:hypothetical protein
LGELISMAGQRRVVGDSAGERRRQGHDRAPRDGADAIGERPDAVVAMPEAPDRGREHHPIAEALGEALRDQLGTAGEAVLLGAALGVEQAVEPARRADVEQDVQE